MEPDRIAVQAALAAAITNPAIRFIVLSASNDPASYRLPFRHATRIRSVA
jgi:hypothetical protein